MNLRKKLSSGLTWWPQQTTDVWTRVVERALRIRKTQSWMWNHRFPLNLHKHVWEWRKSFLDDYLSIKQRSTFNTDGIRQERKVEQAHCTVRTVLFMRLQSINQSIEFPLFWPNMRPSLHQIAKKVSVNVSFQFSSFFTGPSTGSWK